MNMKEFLMFTAIPGAFAGGICFNQWLIEHSNSKLLADGTYVLKAEFESKYIFKEDVEKNYIRNSDIEKYYIKLEKYNDELNKELLLLEKIKVYNEAVVADSRMLEEGEAWKSQNPEFYIEFTSSYYDEVGFTVKLSSAFVDGKPSRTSLYKVGDSKEWKFRYNGKLYKLIATYKKINERIFVETTLSREN